MNKHVIYAQEINCDAGIISEIGAEEIYGILREYEAYGDGYTVINEQIADDIWKTSIHSGDGFYILEIYTRNEPYLGEIQ